MIRTCWNGDHPLPTDRSNLLHNIGGRFVCCPCWCQGATPCRLNPPQMKGEAE